MLRTSSWHISHQSSSSQSSWSPTAQDHKDSLTNSPSHWHKHTKCPMPSKTYKCSHLAGTRHMKLSLMASSWVLSFNWGSTCHCCRRLPEYKWWSSVSYAERSRSTASVWDTPECARCSTRCSLLWWAGRSSSLRFCGACGRPAPSVLSCWVVSRGGGTCPRLRSVMKTLRTSKSQQLHNSTFLLLFSRRRCSPMPRSSFLSCGEISESLVHLGMEIFKFLRVICCSLSTFFTKW